MQVGFNYQESTQMTTRLLVVEDSNAFRKMIVEYLRGHGYDIFEAWSLESARKLLPSVRPSIILLDLQLGDGEGYSLLSEQACANASTIVISVRDGTADRVNCFQLGAEDYIVKPINLEEMLLRIRRIEKLHFAQEMSSFVDFGSFLLDMSGSRVVYPDGESVSLPRSERQLVQLLIEAGDRIITRAAIAEFVFRTPAAENSRAVDVLVSKLRRKLDPTGEASPIWSVRGEGYRFTARRRSRAAAPPDTRAPQ
ncbi:MAG: response regulator transcription factor [Beijerinckiaceae bacterium]|nr:response regulator transcription factor [Beijerinckiaceae bacterium]